jgi:hypothetical protein
VGVPNETGVPKVARERSRSEIKRFQVNASVLDDISLMVKTKINNMIDFHFWEITYRGSG